MTDEEFDSPMGSQPFGTAEAIEAEARMRRCMALGVALWGRTSDDLQRQLLTPWPQIPSGTERFTEWEARGEIVRRAIERLNGRR